MFRSGTGRHLLKLQYGDEATRRERRVRAFHPAVAEWFRNAFASPTPPQRQGWPAIARGASTLILAPTGSGKTLTAFLWCINRLMFEPAPPPKQRCRVLYISPLKALAVDIERNLRAPLAGIANRAAARGDAHHVPTIAVRTGDTPAIERARFQREPADILITTPESLYLLLTSNAREALRSLDTVIIDEIHALVPTKRGAHLALSLERLEAIRPTDASPLQRIGLSATQRPLDEVARYLAGVSTPRGAPAARASRASARGDAPGSGGGPPSPRPRRASPELRGGEAPRPLNKDGSTAEAITAPDAGSPEPRPVTIVDTSEKKRLDLRIEVPVEDMAKIGQPEAIPSGPAAKGPVRSSIWTAIHPRLLELIKAHQSTLIFVNNRRIAERLASALNELAGETLVRSHHGSLARPQRIEVEDRLKAGLIRGLVATSSLELGIDMGAIDLVIQIEAPPSVASGMQRIGRAGHTIDAASRGIIFPKFRGDLVACAAVTRAMHDAHIEATRYPRNPLDILAQQIVAMVSMDPWPVDALFDTVRRAAPFADLSRSVFEGVLDMLSGRYPSDDFADLRPRLTWDRLQHTLTAREERQARRDHQRWNDPGSRALRRVPHRRAWSRRAGRRARRGDGVREPRRRNVPARRLELAHRADYARPRARLARSWRTRQDAVLEGGLHRPSARAGTRDWRAGAHPGADAAWCRRAAIGAPPRPRSTGRREPAPVSRRSGQSRRCRCPTTARS